MEQGDEGLVSGLDEHEPERVVIEGDPLQSRNDRAQSGPAGDYTGR